MVANNPASVSLSMGQVLSIMPHCKKIPEKVFFSGIFKFRTQITNYFFRLKSFAAFLPLDALTRWNVFNPRP